MYEIASNTIKVYPSPAQDQLFIRSNSINAQLVVYNIQGALVKQASLTNGVCQLTIADLPAGMYTVSVKDARGVQNATFIKQ